MRAPLAVALALVACERSTPVTEPRGPREALHQVLHCALGAFGDEPDPARFEGSIRQALRGDRERFVLRAGACESAFATEGGSHPCLARLRTRWSALLSVLQRPGVHAIDQDVAIRKTGEAYAEAFARCPR